MFREEVVITVLFNQIKISVIENIFFHVPLDVLII